MSAPKKAMVVSSLIAAAGYLAYDLLPELGIAELLAYFTGTVIISAGGELMAKFIKVPAVLLIYPAVIPLVPGIGLYQTMLYLLQNNYGGFIETGTKTALIAGVIAAAIAVVNLIVRAAFSSIKK